MLSQLLIMTKSEDSNRRGKLMLKKRLLFIHTETENRLRKQMQSEYVTS